MKMGPAHAIAAIRALSQDLAERLNDQASSASDVRLGQRFFPKRIHELTPVDGDSPGGLSIDYLMLAARLNNSINPSDTPDLLTVLMRTVEAEITRARILEGQLLEAIGRAE